VRSALYASCFVGLWAWLAVSVRRLDDHLPVAMPLWLRPVGIVVGLCGAVLALWCVVAFTTRGRGTPAPFDPPMQFVATGPYRLVRNPMYVGGFGALLGTGLVVMSPAIVALAGFFWLAAHLFVILYEEPTLKRRFGDSYRTYTRSVARWLPWRRP
jgi:protein-S-isoprenylcysteine O-methyltransferase Ste14